MADGKAANRPTVFFRSVRGFAKSKELYLGKYEVKEVKAGYGMVLSSEVHTVELIYAAAKAAPPPPVARSQAYINPKPSAV